MANMNKTKYLQIFSLLPLVIIMSSCSSQKQEDFSFENFNIPKKGKDLNSQNTVPKESEKIDTSNIIDLTPFKDKTTLIKNIEFGREDPFKDLSLTDEVNITGFTFTGIISTPKSIYALVTYKEKSGKLKVGERGGIDTSLLPKGAILNDINLKEKHLKILYGKNNLVIELK
tara:strand:- start:5325 stop:5840 length:516 start_codon:yes stop_codon:yes gene_type:complete